MTSLRSSLPSHVLAFLAEESRVRRRRLPVPEIFGPAAAAAPRPGLPVADGGERARCGRPGEEPARPPRPSSVAGTVGRDLRSRRPFPRFAPEAPRGTPHRSGAENPDEQERR